MTVFGCMDTAAVTASRRSSVTGWAARVAVTVTGSSDSAAVWFVLAASQPDGCLAARQRLSSAALMDDLHAAYLPDQWLSRDALFRNRGMVVSVFKLSVAGA